MTISHPHDPQLRQVPLLRTRKGRERSGLFAVEGEDLVVPPLATGILDSITRRLIAEVAPLNVRARRLDELAAADGALVISTVVESRIVREVMGVAQYDVQGRRVNEIADALRELCVTGDPDGGRAVPA